MGFSAFDGADFKFGSPHSGRPLGEQLAAWSREAVAARRVPCLYLTASWCPPSVMLEKSLTDPLMARALRGVNFATYDIDSSGNELSAAGFPAHSVPVFFLLDADGKRAGPTITGAAWGANTPQNMAPPLERFFDDARAAVAATAAVGAMPDPAVIGELIAARAQPVASAPPRPVAPPQPAAPLVVNQPTASSLPRLLLAGGALLVLAAVAFALTRT
jgi:hypothetical protein